MKFKENPSSESRVAMRTDRHDDANDVFRNFSNSPRKKNTHIRSLILQFIAVKMFCKLSFEIQIP
jgi:hypothetical protein